MCLLIILTLNPSSHGWVYSSRFIDFNLISSIIEIIDPRDRKHKKGTDAQQTKNIQVRLLENKKCDPRDRVLTKKLLEIRILTNNILCQIVALEVILHNKILDLLLVTIHQSPV